jgi:hypothetical protein
LPGRGHFYFALTAAAIELDFADAGKPGRDRAAVAAGIATDAKTLLREEQIFDFATSVP